MNARTHQSPTWTREETLEIRKTAGRLAKGEAVPRRSISAVVAEYFEVLALASESMFAGYLTAPCYRLHRLHAIANGEDLY